MVSVVRNLPQAPTHLVPGRLLASRPGARWRSGLTRLAHNQEIGGSNPPCATIHMILFGFSMAGRLFVTQIRALSSSGRAPALQAGGGRFKSGRVHQFPPRGALAPGGSPWPYRLTKRRPVAQLVERATDNREVGGSSPPRTTNTCAKGPAGRIALRMPAVLEALARTAWLGSCARRAGMRHPMPR